MVLNVHNLTELLPKSPLRGRENLAQFSLNNKLNHMIINNPTLILRSIKQRMSTDLVYQTGSSTGIPKNFIGRIIRKDILFNTGICQVLFYILTHLGAVHMRQFALDVDTLTDGGV